MVTGDRTLILSPESNNIESIYIGGKKVAKILKDGKVFYDNLPTSITLTADKTIVTSGDTINLTATCLNQQEEGCRNKTVTFIDSDTGDVLATGVTDSQGVCTASFSVQSTGNLNIRAKWGIILSETYIIHNSQECSIQIQLEGDTVVQPRTITVKAVTTDEKYTTSVDLKISNNYSATLVLPAGYVFNWELPDFSPFITFSLVSQSSSNNHTQTVYKGIMKGSTPV